MWPIVCWLIDHGLDAWELASLCVSATNAVFQWLDALDGDA